MSKDIPYVSEELMEQIDRILDHGPRRAKSHDQRFGQWLSNAICSKYKCSRQDAGLILCHIENPELLEMVKEYND